MNLTSKNSNRQINPEIYAQKKHPKSIADAFYFNQEAIGPVAGTV